jgi:hypothetical protein
MQPVETASLNLGPEANLPMKDCNDRFRHLAGNAGKWTPSFVANCCAQFRHDLMRRLDRLCVLVN